MSHLQKLTAVSGAVGAWYCPVCKAPATASGLCSCGGLAVAHSPNSMQVGGDHYKTMAIQPVEYILANGLGYPEGAVIKYVSRWKSKGGVEDLKKARHFLDLLIAHVEKP